MAIAPITYRNSGAWGAGKGSALTVAEIDGNFWSVKQLIDAAAAAAGAPVSIADIVVVSGQMSVTLSDATVLGPFTLPKARFNYQGAWTPSAAYGVNDVVKVTGLGVYLVQRVHTAAATFDPDALDGADRIYEILMPAGAGEPVFTSVELFGDIDVLSSVDYGDGGGTLTFTGTPTEVADGITWVEVPATPKGRFAVRNETDKALLFFIDGQPLDGPVVPLGGRATLVSDGINVQFEGTGTSGIDRIIKLSAAEYSAIGTPDPATLYVVV